MHIGMPRHLDRLLVALTTAYGPRAVMAAGPRPGPRPAPRPAPEQGPMSPLPGGLVPQMTLQPGPLRHAREDGIADERARVAGILNLAEAEGLAAMAGELAMAGATIAEARVVLQAARRGAAARRSGPAG